MFDKIETSRLIIRKFMKSDIDELLSYTSEEKVMHYLPQDVYDLNKAKKFIDENSGDDIEEYAVVLKSENKLIGHIGFHEWYAPFNTWEIGWVFNRNYHNKGYASEAAAAMLKYAFEDLKLHRVIATCDTNNTPSYRVMEKIGMRREGCNVRSVYIKGKWRDEYFYAIHDEEWKKMNDIMLETERLIIRRFKSGDWKDLYDYLSKEEVVKYEPYDVYDEEGSKSEAVRRSTDDTFYAVVLKENNKVIGNVYFGKEGPEDFRTWEIGYVFNSDFQHHGYATEACKKIMEYGFKKLNAHRIIAMCNPENSASWRLMERLNMRREATLKKNVFFNRAKDGSPIWQDTYMYGILPKEM